MKIAVKLVFLLLLIISASPVITLASELTVKVLDEGEPVAMAEVFLVDSTTRIIINNDFTDKSGIYIYAAKDGVYEITVTKDDFLDVTIKDIKLNNSNIDKVVELVPSAFGPEGTALQSESDCD